MTIRMFVGMISVSVFVVALTYCIRYKVSRQSYCLAWKDWTYHYILKLLYEHKEINNVWTFAVSLSLIPTSLLCLLLPRRRINQIRMVKGPNKILLTLADVTFINPSLSNKVSLHLTTCWCPTFACIYYKSETTQEEVVNCDVFLYFFMGLDISWTVRIRHQHQHFYVFLRLNLTIWKWFWHWSKTSCLTFWTYLSSEVESGWQQSQRHEEHIRSQHYLTSLHPIPGHIWELQCCNLWGDCI